MKNPDYLLIDLFCGAGGVSTGAAQSGNVKVIAAVNHDDLAIQSHASNHPDTHHFVEDIRTLEMSDLVSIANKFQNQYPDAELVLWASLECTNFSKAKGGLPREADSRTLAEHLPRYIRALNPDKIMIENVEEFLAWGPLDANGKPVSRNNGRDYVRWVKSITALGYKWEWKILNSADYGAYTSRRRLFGVFHRDEVAIWPEPTHVKRPVAGSLFKEDKKPWKPVGEVLDFSDLGSSIFDRPKPLVDNTLKRILRGLKKYVTQPMLMTCNTPGYCASIDNPASTITTVGHKALVVPVVATNYTPGTNRSIDEPAQTITAGTNLHMVSAIIPMLQTYYGNGGVTGMDEPASTITTKDRISLVTPISYIDRDFISGADSSIDNPAGSITTVPKMNLATAFLVNPQYNNVGNPIDKPAPTVIASQKSYPLSLAVAVSGGDKIQDKPGDTEAMAELKKFCRDHNIADVFLRMLKVAELKKIQGFPDDYVLCGSQDHQKKFIGNSVTPPVTKAWFKAMAKSKRALKTVA